MIMKQNNRIIKKVLELLANDETIRTLLFYANESGEEIPSAQYILDKKYIMDYPVILEANDKHTFISVHHDNTLVVENNIYVNTFKVSCGVSLDAWHTTDGDSRILLLADKVEEILSEQHICDSTGPFTLEAINSIYWNSFVTGISLIFQVVEQGEINESIV